MRIFFIINKKNRRNTDSGPKRRYTPGLVKAANPKNQEAKTIFFLDCVTFINFIRKKRKSVNKNAYNISGLKLLAQQNILKSDAARKAATHPTL